MGRVHLRVPLRSFLIAVLGACAYPAWTLTASPLRPDLGAVPITWTIAIGLLWLAGFCFPLALTVLPTKGHVLPDGARAFRLASLMAAASTGASLLLGLAILRGGNPGAPGPAPTVMSWRDCLAVGLKVSVPTIVVSALALRRLVLAESWRWGAAVGAAGGMLAGLTLHLTCSNCRPGHLLAHAGGIVAGALLGVLTRLALDRTGR